MGYFIQFCAAESLPRSAKCQQEIAEPRNRLDIVAVSQKDAVSNGP